MTFVTTDPADLPHAIPEKAPEQANARAHARASLHEALRAATRPAHERIDAAFGALDLSARADYARFLVAHRTALAPLAPAIDRFCTRELSLPAPAWLAMLDADLTELGLPLPASPVAAMAADDLAEAAATYVVTGSRLGLAVLRRAGLWGERENCAARYVRDEGGRVLWRALAGWMAARPATLAGPLADRAVIVFDRFAAALTATGDTVTPATLRGAA